MAEITFKKENITQDVRSGSDFLHVHMQHPALPLKFGCKQGDCGICTIHILEGMENLTKITKEEINMRAKGKLPQGCRLACQCAINGDIVIE